MKRGVTENFIDEIYSIPPRKIYPTKKIINNHIDETWNIDLIDMSNSKSSDNKTFSYFFITIDNFSN